MANPIQGPMLITPQRHQVEKVVCAHQDVQPTGIGRVGVENVTGIIAIEHTQAWQFPFFAAIGFVVVGERARGNLLVGGSDLKVFVERGAMG
ncbi:hypothetical protein D3C85_856130 [compost metagenome]